MKPSNEEETHIDLKPVRPEPRWYKQVLEWIGIGVLAAAAAIGAYYYAEYRDMKEKQYRAHVEKELKEATDYYKGLKLVETKEE